MKEAEQGKVYEAENREVHIKPDWLIIRQIKGKNIEPVRNRLTLRLLQIKKQKKPQKATSFVFVKFRA